jgi:hypothetical protein
MILALRANLLDSSLLAMCLLLFPIPYYFTHTELRYRHPIDPFMTLFTVYAIVRLCSALRGRVARISRMNSVEVSGRVYREQEQRRSGAMR